jgi:hypothetical protein
MAYLSHAGALTVNGATWLVNARKSGIYTEMAKRMIGQIDAMLTHHSKIHIVRFDLHQPDYTPDNSRMSLFNRYLHNRLITRYKLARIGFVWARERAKGQHYHCALIMDGHKINYPHQVLELICELWEFLDGSVWKPKNCYYNVQRQDHAKLQAAIWRISYLAKGRGKGYRPEQTKNYSTSRIKPLTAQR